MKQSILSNAESSRSASLQREMWHCAVLFACAVFRVEWENGTWHFATVPEFPRLAPTQSKGDSFNKTGAILAEH